MERETCCIKAGTEHETCARCQAVDTDGEFCQRDAVRVVTVSHPAFVGTDGHSHGAGMFRLEMCDACADRHEAK